METRINILGLDIDIIDQDFLRLKLVDFLNSSELHLLFFVTTETILKICEEKELQQQLMQADLVLPGNEMVLTGHHVATLKTACMIVDGTCMKQIFQEISDAQETIYIIGKKENEIKQYEAYWKKNYPGITVVGSYSETLEDDEAFVVNEINSLTPGILMVSLESPLQEKWILENQMKLNAKLCLGIGGISDYFLRHIEKTPSWIRKLHLHKQYHWWKEHIKIKNWKNNRIFQKKLVYDRMKKGEKKDGTMD